MQKNESQRIAETFETKIGEEPERERREKALDEAIENTFPASDPVSAEQPVSVARAWNVSVQQSGAIVVTSILAGLHHQFVRI